MKKITEYITSYPFFQERPFLSGRSIITVCLFFIIFGFTNCSNHNSNNKSTTNFYVAQDSNSSDLKHEGSHIFYVDRDVNKEGDGSSWTNAARSVHSLPWSLIQAEDTVYISGGTDSTIYPKDWVKNKIAIGGDVIITRGIDAGHNGAVYFAQTGKPSGIKASFYLSNCEHIKLTGMRFISLVSGTSGDGIISLSNGDKNTIENCFIESNGTAYGIYGQAESRTTIVNDSIITIFNAEPYGNDPIYFGGGEGGLNVIGNVIINYKTDYTAHPDVFQTNVIGSVNNYQTIIANNLIMVPNRTTPDCRGIYFSDMSNQRLLIYNNIILMNSASGNSIAANGLNSNSHISLRIFNNTMLCGTSYDMEIRIGNIDTLIMKNNLLISDSTGRENLAFVTSKLSDVRYKEIDYNQYYRKGGVALIDTGGGIVNWATWKALGNDFHGANSAVIFENPWGFFKIDYLLARGSNGLKEGVNLSSYFSIDILNNARSLKSAWDRGAVER